MDLPPFRRVRRAEATRLRQQKQAALRRFARPAGGLAGALALIQRRYGKANCHCGQGEGHPQWLLTFLVDGQKRVEAVPSEWVEDVRRRGGAGGAASEG